MNLKFIKKLFCLVGSIVLFSTMQVQAASSDPISFHNISGKVKIRLETLMMSEGKEKICGEGALQNVLPGEKISRITRIYNEGEDCYLRAAVTFENKKDGTPMLTEECLKGTGKDWKKLNGFYYYTKVLPSNKSIDLFREISIPSEWTQEQCEGNQWNVKVTAEAVQAENLHPDFTSEDPWKMKEENFEILKAGNEKVPEEKHKNSPVELIISKDMKKFTVEDGDFFRGMETFVPGTVRTGKIGLTNQTAGNRKVYFRVEADDTNILLQQMELKVKINDGKNTNILYQGPVCTEKNGKQQYLGMFPSGERKEVEFEILLPKEADNRYIAKEGEIKVFFMTDAAKIEKREIVRTSDPVSGSSFWGMLLSAFLIPVAVQKVRSFHKGGRVCGKNM